MNFFYFIQAFVFTTNHYLKHFVTVAISLADIGLNIYDKSDGT